MKKEEFKNFVRKTLEELKLYAELHMAKSLPDEFELEWGLSKSENRYIGKNTVIDEITKRVFLGENKIYPCVDLVVKKISEENRILIGGRIAGYEPREFGPNWTKRLGPFIYGVSQELVNDNIDYKSEEFKDILRNKGLRFS
ncbi:MAG: hypothetical protein AAGA43_16400 [Bacteroidota bacterium]